MSFTIHPPSRSRSQFALHTVLSDPNLISPTQPLLDASTRSKFEQAVRRYYYQLTIGCNSATCTTRLCKSCKNAHVYLPEAAAVLSVQLASRPHTYMFCPNCPTEPNIRLPLLKTSCRSSNTPRHTVSPPTAAPFLHSMLSSSSFESLFTSSPSPLSRNSSSTDLLSSTPTHLSKPKLDSSSSTTTTTTTKLPKSRSSTLLNDLSSTLCDMTSSLTRSISYQLLGHSFLSSALESNAANPSNIPITRSFMDIHQHQQDVSETIPSSSYTSTYSLCSLALPDNSSDISGVLNTLSFSLWTDTVHKLSTLTENDESSSSDQLEFGLDTDAHAFLQASIRHVFSHPEVLARSFRLPSSQDRHSSSNSPTIDVTSDCKSSTNSGLDLSSIPLTYNSILSLVPADQYRLSLTDAIELLLARINTDTYSSFDNPVKLTLIPILLANPLLNDPAVAESLVRPILTLVANLKPKPKTVLVQWFAQYPKDMFMDLIETVKTYLSAHFHPTPKPTDGVVIAIRVLGMLYCANELRPSSDLVPYQTFYIPRLNTDLNFKDEYRTWRKVLDQLGHKQVCCQFSYLSYPFLFDATAKSRILHIDAMVQMAQEYEDACVSQALVVHTQKMLLADPSRSHAMESQLKHITNPYMVLNIGRHHIVQDVMAQVCLKTPAELKRPLKVKFKNEEGLDAGGVQKEFFLLLVDQLLDPKYGMFTYDEETRYSWLNQASFESIREYELVGMVLGLALYNGVIVDVRFPKLFYKRLLGEQPTIYDVIQTWPDLGRGLVQLLNWDEQTGGTVEDVFCRSFDVSVQGIGSVSTIELVPNGSNIPVTAANRDQYVQLYVEWCTKKSVNKAFHALRRGFHQVCGGYAVNMCRAEELELLMCGQEIEMDLKELEAVCEYDDGYDAQHPVIRWFWTTVHMHFNNDQRKKLVEFVTASDRAPLKGIASLTFVIQRNGPDSDRLPTALTCFSRLLLPEYASEQKLRRFLITAVENAKGFGLI